MCSVVCNPLGWGGRGVIGREFSRNGTSLAGVGGEKEGGGGGLSGGMRNGGVVVAWDLFWSRTLCLWPIQVVPWTCLVIFFVCRTRECVVVSAVVCGRRSGRWGRGVQRGDVDEDSGRPCNGLCCSSRWFRADDL